MGIKTFQYSNKRMAASFDSSSSSSSNIRQFTKVGSRSFAFFSLNSSYRNKKEILMISLVSHCPEKLLDYTFLQGIVVLFIQVRRFEAQWELLGGSLHLKRSLQLQHSNIYMLENNISPETLKELQELNEYRQNVFFKHNTDVRMFQKAIRNGNLNEDSIIKCLIEGSYFFHNTKLMLQNKILPFMTPVILAVEKNDQQVIVYLLCDFKHQQGSEIEFLESFGSTILKLCRLSKTIDWRTQPPRIKTCLQLMVWLQKQILFKQRSILTQISRFSILNNLSKNESQELAVEQTLLYSYSDISLCLQQFSRHQFVANAKKFQQTQNSEKAKRITAKISFISTICNQDFVGYFIQKVNYLSSCNITFVKKNIQSKCGIEAQSYYILSTPVKAKQVYRIRDRAIVAALVMRFQLKQYPPNCHQQEPNVNTFLRKLDYYLRWIDVNYTGV